MRTGSCSHCSRQLPASSEAVFGEPSPLPCAARGQLHAGAGGWGGGWLVTEAQGRKTGFPDLESDLPSKPTLRGIALDRSLDSVHVAGCAGRTAREMLKGRMCAGIQASFRRN